MPPNFKHYYVTHILLPVKVTKDMVEKGAEDLFPTHYVGDREVLQNFTRDHRNAFKKAINWLLNYKEDNK